jgi:hypothetical protein
VCPIPSRLSSIVGSDLFFQKTDIAFVLRLSQFRLMISKPTQDVLCGRGALTNEHPGNEWFRRLVRSNRQLYRSCPKHTKLLVAKAIVQAVQRSQRNPPGRFLEKTKTSDGSVSNSWTPITYKSAVEKASQALREKVTPNWGAPPSNFPLSKALEAARAVAYLEKEYPSGDGFGGTNLLALIMAVVQSAGLD